MREDEKRNFLGIVMGGCGRYVFFLSFFFFFFWRDEGGWGWGWEGMELVQGWNWMYDV